MSFRHIHCVYFKYDNNPSLLDGYCLLKQKHISYGYKPQCDKAVVIPSELLSAYLVTKGYCNKWFSADKQATDFLNEMGLNDYPGGDEE